MNLLVALLIFIFAVISLFVTIAAVLSALPLILVATLAVLLSKVFIDCIKRHSVL